MISGKAPLAKHIHNQFDKNLHALDKDTAPPMAPGLRRSTQTANLTPATRFDRGFRGFRFGKRNTTEEYPTCSGSAGLFESFVKKVDSVYEMPNDETLNNSIKAVGNVMKESSSSNNQHGSQAGAVNPNQQLVDMLIQLNEALLSCMQEIDNLKKEREQQQISYAELFAEFHSLGAEQANKWYWQLLEVHEEDATFDYFASKGELLNQSKTADSYYELIREVMGPKQQQSKSFEDYYAEIHDLTFWLRKKVSEQELIKIINSNPKPSLATLIFATKVGSVAERKAECKKAEKLLRESRARVRYINEVSQEGDSIHGTLMEAVEAFQPRHAKGSGTQREGASADKIDGRWANAYSAGKQHEERRQPQFTTSRAG
uniref:Retrotransposon gag domain-containing protein n=1 Tax=Glossina morsitans morsitans TaxID=37546 RepID=A0A1B0GD80_GLOMM